MSSKRRSFLADIKARSRKSKAAARRSALRKRRLISEQLEDRRLLAADFDQVPAGAVEVAQTNAASESFAPINVLTQYQSDWAESLAGRIADETPQMLTESDFRNDTSSYDEFGLTLGHRPTEILHASQPYSYAAMSSTSSSSGSSTSSGSGTSTSTGSSSTSNTSSTSTGTGSGASPDLPGDDLANARVVALTPAIPTELNETIGDGLHGNRDVDLYRVSLDAGQSLSIDIDAYSDDNSNQLSTLDSYVRVFDSSGTQLASNDAGVAANDDANAYDSYLAFTASSSGDYYVGVSGDGNQTYIPSSAASGVVGSTGAYRLQLLADTPPAPVVPVASVSDVSVAEDAGSVSFIVSLDVAATSPVTVNYQTVNGTATAGSDFVSVSGTLTFAPGQTGQSVLVTLPDDSVDESDETFDLVLSNPVGITIQSATATATILDNDVPPLPTVAVSDASVAEDAGNITFTVSLSGPSSDTVTLNYQTTNGTAVAPADYTATSGSVSFAPGVTSRTFTVPVILDVTQEGTESFTVSVTNAVNATIADGIGIGTISNVSPAVTDPVLPKISVSDATVSEAAGTALFTLTLDVAAATNVSVQYQTTSGSAIAGQDFVSSSGTLTFAPGELSKTLAVSILDDSEVESSQSFIVALSNPIGATLLDGQASGVITDNDVAAPGDPGVAPVGASDFYSIGSSLTLSVQAPGVLTNDADADGDSLTVGLIDRPANGTMGLESDGSFYYVPDPQFVGIDSFTYRPSDHQVEGALVTVYIDVLNRAPIANDDTFIVQPGTSYDFDVRNNDPDPEGQPLQVILDSNPAGQIETNPDGSFVYTPASGFTGTDSFVYHVSDGNLESATATVTFRVVDELPSQATNAAPKANPDYYSTTRNQSLTVPVPGVLANDFDLESDSLTVELESIPRYGTLSANSDGSFEYVPYPEFSGVDSFQYRAFDATGRSFPATVDIDVIESAAAILDLAAKPNVITVNSAFQDASTGQVTLRDAIEIANASNALTNVIEFNLAPGAAIQLHSADGPLSIRSHVEIRGGQTPVEIWTEDAMRLLYVEPGREVKISNLVFTGGSLSTGDGAGILNEGLLTLDQVYVHGNNALSGRGGGIFNAPSASLSLVRSTVSGNSSQMDGGGIFNAAGSDLDVNTSTVSGNVSSLWGGGIYNAGSAIVAASTIVENQAVTASNVAAVESVSFSDSIVALGSGSPDIDGYIHSVGGNLVGDGSAATGFNAVLGDLVGDDQLAIDPRVGLLQLNGGTTPTHLLLPGSPAIDAGRQLHRFEDQRGAERTLNGGETTNPNDSEASPDIGATEFGAFVVNTAYDAIDTTPLGDGRVDVDPSTPGDQITLRAAIQELNAIGGIGNQVGGGQQQFEGSVQFDFLDPTVIQVDIQGNGEDLGETGDLDIYGDIHIAGSLKPNGESQVRIRGPWADAEDHGLSQNAGSDVSVIYSYDRIFHVHDGANVDLSLLNISGGSAVFAQGIGRGGAILSENANVYVRNSDIQNNFAHFGAGVHTVGGTTVIDRGTVIDSNLASSGGGIYLQSGELVVADSSLVDNFQTRRGAGIYVEAGNARIHEGSHFEGQGLDTAFRDGFNTNAGTLNINNVNGSGYIVAEGTVLYLQSGTVQFDASSTALNSEVIDSYTAEILLPALAGFNESLYSATSEFLIEEQGTFEASSMTFSDDLLTEGRNATILTSGNVTIEDSVFLGDNSIYTGGPVLVNYRTGHAAFRNTVITGVSGGSTEDYWTPYGTYSVDAWNGYTYETAPIVGAVIQNHGGRLSFLNSTLTNGKETDTGVVSIASLGLGAELNIIDSSISGNHSSDFPSVYNQDGTLNLLNSVIHSNVLVPTGLWVGAVQHIGHGQYLASNDGYGAEVVQHFVPGLDDEDGNPLPQIVHVDDASVFQDRTLPMDVTIDGAQLTIAHVDFAANAVEVSSYIEGPVLKGAKIKHDTVDESTNASIRDFKKFGNVSKLELSEPVWLDDRELYIFDAAAFQSYSLPMDIVVDNERMTVTEVDFDSDRLHVTRTEPASHQPGAKVVVHNEYSTEMRIKNLEQIAQYDLPMDVYVAVYDPDTVEHRSASSIVNRSAYGIEGGYYGPNGGHDTLDPSVYLTEDPDLHGEHSFGVRQPKTSLQIAPNAEAAEVMTITAIDLETGIAAIERGRHGTVPIRFGEDSHIWGLPGAMTISGTTFSGNSISAHEYYSDDRVPPSSGLEAHDQTQAIIRTEVAEFAPPSVVENVTIAGSETWGPFASIWTERTTLFAGQNPKRYDTFSVAVDDDAAGIEIGDSVAVNETSVRLENSVLADARFTGDGQELASILQLPNGQLYQNFIEAKALDVGVSPDLDPNQETPVAVPVGDANDSNSNGEGGEAGSGEPDSSDGSASGPTGAVPGQSHYFDLPPLELSVVDNGGAKFGALGTASGLFETAVGAFGQDRLVFSTNDPESIAHYQFDDLSIVKDGLASVYSVSSSFVGGVESSFVARVLLENVAEEGVAKDEFVSIGQLRTESHSLDGSVMQQFTVSRRIPGRIKFVRIENEVMGLLAETDNSDGTYSYTVARGISANLVTYAANFQPLVDLLVTKYDEAGVSVSTRLSESIDESASFVVVDEIPIVPGETITIENEIMEVIGMTDNGDGTHTYEVVRGADGSSSQSHSAGLSVELPGQNRPEGAVSRLVAPVLTNSSSITVEGLLIKPDQTVQIEDETLVVTNVIDNGDGTHTYDVIRGFGNLTGGEYSVGDWVRLNGRIGPTEVSNPLATSIDADATSLTVRHARSFGGRYIQIGQEQLEVTGVTVNDNGSHTYDLIRGVRDTVPQSHDVDSAVVMLDRINSKSYEQSGFVLQSGLDRESETFVTAHPLPESWVTVRINNEELLITDVDEVAGQYSYTVARAQRNTQATDHAAEDSIVWRQRVYAERVVEVATQLRQAITIDASTIVVAATQGDPGEFVRIDDEQLQVVSITDNEDGTHTYDVIRGVNGTFATSHPDQAQVVMLDRLFYDPMFDREWIRVFDSISIDDAYVKDYWSDGLSRLAVQIVADPNAVGSTFVADAIRVQQTDIPELLPWETSPLIDPDEVIAALAEPENAGDGSADEDADTTEVADETAIDSEPLNDTRSFIERLRSRYEENALQQAACDSQGHAVDFTAFDDSIQWEFAGLDQGSYYILTRWDGTDDQPSAVIDSETGKLVTPPNPQDGVDYTTAEAWLDLYRDGVEGSGVDTSALSSPWWILSEVEVHGKSLVVQSHASVSDLTGENNHFDSVCIITPDQYQHLFTGLSAVEDFGGLNGYAQTLRTEQTRFIADDGGNSLGYATVELFGGTQLDESTGFAGSQRILGEDAFAQWTFEDLAPGEYVVSSSAIPDYYYPEMSFEIEDQNSALLSQGQVVFQPTVRYSESGIPVGDEFQYSHARSGQLNVHDVGELVFIEEYENTDGSNDTDETYSQKRIDLTSEFYLTSPDLENPINFENRSQFQHWIVLDAIGFSGGDLTVRVDGTAAGTLADAIRIERVGSSDARLLPLTYLAGEKAGQRPDDNSPLNDQGHDQLAKGLDGKLLGSIRASYRDTHLKLSNVQEFVHSESNLLAPVFPYTFDIRAETLRAVGYDPQSDSLVVERGVLGTIPEEHLAGTSVVQGFDGLRTYLVAAANDLNSQLIVTSVDGLPTTRQFDVRVGSEEMTVTDVTDNFDGTYTFEVLRAVRDTSVESYLPVDTQVRVLADAIGGHRFVNGVGQGYRTVDFGAIETFYVDVQSSADSVDLIPGDGFVTTAAGEHSLRAAIMEANRLGGTASIRLSAGTHYLSLPETNDEFGESGGDLDITGNLSIEGPAGGTAVINASLLERVFDVHPGASLSLINVTVKGGSTNESGGGIRVNGGSLSLIESTVTGNAANSGAGVFAVDSDVRVIRSTIEGNHATHDGGAIALHRSQIEISQSTISGNSADGTAGAVFVDASSSAMLESSTIAFNSANDVGGIVAVGTAEMKLTAVAHNLHNVTGSPDVGGKIRSQGNNFIGVNQTAKTYVYDSSTAWQHASHTLTVTDPFNLPQTPFHVLVNGNELLVSQVRGNVLHLDQSYADSSWLDFADGSEVRFDGIWAPTDHTGSLEDPLDAMLGPLASYGGATESHAPLEGSPLIDAGPRPEGTIARIDQNSSVRFVDTTRDGLMKQDIGSVEVFNWVAIESTDAVKPEPDPGFTETYEFEVTRGASADVLILDYVVAGHGPDPATETDFAGDEFPSGQIVFLAGETSKTVSVQVSGDLSVESAQRFGVYVRGASELLTYKNDVAYGTIANDDTGQIVVSDLSVFEDLANVPDDGDPSTPRLTEMTMTVSLTNDVEGGFSVPLLASLRDGLEVIVPAGQFSGGGGGQHTTTLEFEGYQGESIEFVFQTPVDEFDEPHAIVWMMAGEIEGSTRTQRRAITSISGAGQFANDDQGGPLRPFVAFQPDDNNDDNSGGQDAADDGTGSGGTEGDSEDTSGDSEDTSGDSEDTSGDSEDTSGDSEDTSGGADGMGGTDGDDGSSNGSASGSTDGESASDRPFTGYHQEDLAHTWDYIAVNLEPYPPLDPDASGNCDSGSPEYSIWHLQVAAEAAYQTSMDAQINAMLPGRPQAAGGSEWLNQATIYVGAESDSDAFGRLVQERDFHWYQHVWPECHVPDEEPVEVELDPANPVITYLDPRPKAPDDPIPAADYHVPGWIEHESAGDVPNSDVSVSDFDLDEIVADYSVSHADTLTFNPIASYSIPADMTLTGTPELSLKVRSPGGQWTDSIEFSEVRRFDGNGDGAINATDEADNPDKGVFLLAGVSVNPDMTVTFTPNSDEVRSGLSPRRDASGNIFQYDRFFDFEVAVTLAGVTTPLAETGVGLQVVDNLPVLRGDRIHQADSVTKRLYLDGPVYVDFESTMRIDLAELLIDEDGDQVEILDIDTGGGFESAAIRTDDGSVFFEIGDKELATVHRPLSGVLPLVGDINPRANVGTDVTTWRKLSTEYLRVKRLSGTIVDLHNPLSENDVVSSLHQLKRFSSGPATELATVRLLVTDPTQRAANGDYIVRVLELDVHARHEGDVNAAISQTTQPWVKKVEPTLPERHPVVNAPLVYNEDGVLAQAPLPESLNLPDPTLWSVKSADIGVNRSFESVGGTAVDLVGGTFLVNHDLILDGSGGASELALPGLVYDSATVHVTGKQVPVIQTEITRPTGAAGSHTVKAKLTWYDHNEPSVGVLATQSRYGNEVYSEETFTFVWGDDDVQVLALPVGQAPTKTGLYSWKMDVTIDSNVITTHGQTPIVVNQGDDAVFGEGWALAGVPTIALDRYDGGTSHSMYWNKDGFDDRLILAFPGQEPVIFDYSDLTVASKPLPLQLPAIQAGAKSNGRKGIGFADVQEYGTLTARHDDVYLSTHPETRDNDKPDELVYKAPDGTEYVFYRHEIDGEISYLINRIEQPGIDFDPTVNPFASDPGYTGRRGVSFEHSDAGKLTAIVASDGARTTLGYAGDKVNEFAYGPAGASRVVQLSVSETLDSITHVNAAPADFAGASVTDPVHAFGYVTGTGLMTTNQWKTGSDVDRLTEYFYAPQTEPDNEWDDGGDPRILVSKELGLATIRVGAEISSPASATENTMFYYIKPAALTGLVPSEVERNQAHLREMMAEVLVNAHDFEGLNQTGVVTDTSGLQTQEFAFNSLNQLRTQRLLFDGDLISKTEFKYDAVGSVVKTAGLDTSDGSDWAVSTYRYDYEIPGSVGTTNTNYDPSDYRGNVIYAKGPTDLQKFEYETDDDEGDAVGRLTLATTISGGAAAVVTHYERQKDGRLTKQRTERGGDAQVTNTAGKDLVQSWSYYGGSGDLNTGVLASSTDTRGLTTSFDTYEDGQVAETKTTDSEYSSDVSVAYSYDDYGYPKTVVNKLGTDTTSVVRQSYDRLGMLRRATTEDSVGTILAANEIDYDVTGTPVVTRVPVVDGGSGTEQDLINRWVYDQAGFLVSRVEAEGASYDSYYTGQSQSITQTTEFSYYADGSAQTTTFPGGATLSHYYDPIDRHQWTVTDKIAGMGGAIDQTSVTQTTFNSIGGVDASVDAQSATRVSSGVSVDDPFSSAAPNVSVGGASPLNVTNSTTANGLGQTISTSLATGQHLTNQYDTLGGALSVRNHAYSDALSETSTNAAGDVLSQIERRYDSSGDLIGTYTTTLRYDEFGRLREVSDPLAGVETGATAATIDYEYDPNFHAVLITSTSRTGVVTKEWFDAANQLIRSENALQGVTTYDYDKAGRVQTQSFAPGETDVSATELTYQYDRLGRLRNTVSRIEPGSADTSGVSPFETFQAVDYFDLDSTTGDGWNLIQYVALPGNGAGGIAADQKFQATRTRTDAAGTPVLIQAPDPDNFLGNTPTTLIEYDDHNGDATFVGQQTVTTTLYPAANVTASGAIPTSTDNAQDRKSQAVYNALGKLIESRLHDQAAPGGGTPTYTLLQRNVYDPLTGRLAKSIDKLGNETLYGYDPATGQVNSVTKPNGEITQYEYDSAGNRTRLLYSGVPNGSGGHIGGGDTRWTYDALSRVTRDTIVGITKADGTDAFRQWHYEGHKTTYTDRDGVVTTHLVNPSAGTIVVDATGGGYTYSRDETYNSDGSAKSLDESLNVGAVALYATSIVYDADFADGTTEQQFAFDFGSQSIDQTITTTVDDRGQLDTRSVAFGSLGAASSPTKLWQDDFDFDVLGRLESRERIIDDLSGDVAAIWGGADEPEDRLMKYDYLVDGSRRSAERHGLVLESVSEYDYTTGGRLAGIDHMNANYIPLATHEYGYDGVGRTNLSETSYYDHASSLLYESVRTFAYDTAGQLTQATEVIDGVAQPNRDYTNGQSSTSGDWIVGTDNRLSQDDNYTYLYDLEGHMTRRTALDPAAAISMEEFTWDPAGRLVEVQQYTGGIDPDQTLQYGYDAMGRKSGRRALAADGTTVTSETGYTYEGLQVAAEIDLTGADPVITKLYLHGPQPNEIVATDVLIPAEPNHTSTTAGYTGVWAFTDKLGSVTTTGTMVSGALQLVHTATTEYGETTTQVGDTGNSALLAAASLWAGHHIDPATGLADAKARWYAPDTGRFISQDPLGFEAGDANLYRYVGNGPTNATDPSGLKDPSVTTQTFGPYDNNRVLHAPGPGQWMTGVSRISSDCISGRDTYTCLSLPVDDVASQWLTDARTTQAAADLMYRDMRSIMNGFSGVAVKQSALAALSGVRHVRWADRPGFSPFIEDTTHNGTPYKVIWRYSSRKGRIGEIEAMQWGVVPGNLSDEDAAQFYIDDFEQRMSAAKTQTAIDVSLIAGGQFLATFRAMRLASVCRSASLEASLAARTMTRNEWATYSRLQRIGQQGVAAKAEQVLSSYVARIPASERGNIATTVAAYNRNNGLIAIGTNGDIPSRIASPLARAAEEVGGVGHSFSVVQQNGRTYRLTVGRCAEFHAGNTLLLRTPGSTLSDIGFTKAIRPRSGEVISPCLNCEQMYWLPYLIGH